jgi:hypothetical protein
MQAAAELAAVQQAWCMPAPHRTRCIAQPTACNSSLTQHTQHQLAGMAAAHRAWGAMLNCPMRRALTRPCLCLRPCSSPRVRAGGRLTCQKTRLRRSPSSAPGWPTCGAGRRWQGWSSRCGRQGVPGPVQQRLAAPAVDAACACSVGLFSQHEVRLRLCCTSTTLPAPCAAV